VQAGFRTDFTRGRNTLTVQGDVYDGSNERAGPGSQSAFGANLLGRWQWQTDRSEIQLQGYFDHVDRGAPVEGVPAEVDTWDFEAQQTLLMGAGHQLVWGAGARFSDYRIENSTSLLFDPDEDVLKIWNVFAQDTISLGSALRLTLGVKLEHNPFTGWEPQPDARLAWQASDATMVWAAASRAVRAPTPFDVDVIERAGDLTFLQGNDAFRSEEVFTYELGLRSNLADSLALSMSAFYNWYDDLRTVEPAATPSLLPLRWDNLMAGHTYGMTAWAQWQIRDWWRLSPGFTVLEKRLHFQDGASALLDTGQSGNDPEVHALLNSAMNIGGRQTLDVSLRYVGRLPDPALPAYTELSARYAVQVSRTLELSLRGVNLLHERHQEYPGPDGVFIGRSIMAEARWRP
jgi:iron complex outermembrane receptor protein